MKKRFFFFLSERGAVTVDWVAVTAAVIGIGLIILIPIGYSTDSVAVKIANDVAGQPVGYNR